MVSGYFIAILLHKYGGSSYQLASYYGIEPPKPRPRVLFLVLLEATVQNACLSHTIGVLMIRIGFGDIFYHNRNYNKEPPEQ